MYKFWSGKQDSTGSNLGVCLGFFLPFFSGVVKFNKRFADTVLPK